MKFVILFCLALCGASFADKLDLSQLVPQLVKATDELSKDNYKQAKAVGLLQIKNIYQLLKNAEPSLDLTVEAFTATEKRLVKVFDQIRRAKNGQGATKIDIPENLLNQMETTVQQFSNLYVSIVPVLTDYVDTYNDNVNEFSVTPNGYLKLPLSFIRQTQVTENTISQFHYNVATKVKDLVKQLKEAQRVYKPSKSIIDKKFFEPIENTFKVLRDGNDSIGKDIDLLVQKLKQIKSVFKEKKKGTCVYVPIDKFVEAVTSQTTALGNTYAGIGNAATNLRNTLRDLADRLG